MGRKKVDDARPLRTFTDSLRVELTNDERAEIAFELAGEQGRLDVARREKDEATKMHAATIKDHEGRIAKLATIVNQGWDYRQVEVEEREDWEGKRVFQVRTDTGAEIFERPMTEEERQKPLPLNA